MTAAAIAVPIREFVVRSFNGQQVADGDERAKVLRQLLEANLRHYRLIAPKVSPRTR